MECHETCCFDCDLVPEGEYPTLEHCESICCDILSGDTDKPSTCCFYENKRCVI